MPCRESLFEVEVQGCALAMRSFVGIIDISVDWLHGWEKNHNS